MSAYHVMKELVHASALRISSYGCAREVRITLLSCAPRTLSMDQFFHILRLNTGRWSGLWESQLGSKTIRESTPFFVSVLQFVLLNNFG